MYGTTSGKAIVKISNSFTLKYVHFTGKEFFLLPFIVYEFLCLLLFITVLVLVVLVLGVYAPGGVDVTTTVSVGVIGTIWTGLEI